MNEKIKRVIAIIDSWFVECSVCKETFIPTRKTNTRCVDCQMKNLHEERLE